MQLRPLGTDIAVRLLERLLEMIGEKHNVHVKLDHAVAVESHPGKQMWLRRSFPLLQNLYSDVGEVGFDKVGFTVQYSSTHALSASAVYCVQQKYSTYSTYST